MRQIIYILLILFTFGCGTGRIVTTEDTKPTETIVFGKLTLNSNRPLINKKTLVHFNERLWGKYAVWLDDNGYFYMKLPLGKNFIALLEYREGTGFYKNIPDNLVSINLSSSEHIYYIGDIVFDWTPTEQNQRKQGGAAGAVIEAKQKAEKLPVTIQKSDLTINYFEQKFPENKKEVITELMKVEE